jgi:hypothetical protein
VKGTGDQDATAIEVQSWRSAVHVPIGSIVGEADASRLPVAATLAGGLVLGAEFRLPDGAVGVALGPDVAVGADGAQPTKRSNAAIAVMQLG